MNCRPRHAALLMVAIAIVFISDPVMAKPSSKAKYPRSGFNFAFETGRGNRIDTYKGTVTKDLISSPDTTIRLQLTNAEMDRVYGKMIDIGFFDIPQHQLSRHTAGPRDPIRIVATAGKHTKRLAWRWGERIDDWQGLSELDRLIWAIVHDRREYRALPKAKGGYL